MKKAARLAPIVAPAAARDAVELAAAAGVKVPRRLQALRKPSPGKMEKASPSERRQSQRYSPYKAQPKIRRAAPEGTRLPPLQRRATDEALNSPFDSIALATPADAPISARTRGARWGAAAAAAPAVAAAAPAAAPAPAPAPPPPVARPPSGPVSMSKRAAERARRRQAEAAQRRSREEEAAESMVHELRAYDGTLPPPPRAADEALLETDLQPLELTALRDRVTRALDAVCDDADGRYARYQRLGRPAAIERTQMYAFLGHLVAATIGTAAPAPAAPRGRAGSSSSVADAAAAAAPTVDGWAAGALFDAVARVSRSADGKLRADELLGALAPAWGKTRRSRRAWIWYSFYDVERTHALAPREIFALLDKIPEGSALEDDVLGLVRRCASKLDAGEPRCEVAVAEYLADADAAEPDVLGLEAARGGRRKRRGGRENLRLRARAAILAQRLGIQLSPLKGPRASEG